MDEQTADQVYAQLRSKYPNAHVHASTFDAFYEVAKDNLEGLPVITEEIGDTWL